MKKCIIIIILNLLLSGSFADAQINPIKRQKHKTEMRAKKPEQTSSNTQVKQKQTPSTAKSEAKNEKKTVKKNGKGENRSTKSSLVNNNKNRKQGKGSDSNSSKRYINVYCDVSDGIMYIDGSYFGKANGLHEVSDGTHSVKIVANGYNDYNTRINVSSSSTSFRFVLKGKQSTNNRNNMSKCRNI